MDTLSDTVLFDVADTSDDDTATLPTYYAPERRPAPRPEHHGAPVPALEQHFGYFDA